MTHAAYLETLGRKPRLRPEEELQKAIWQHIKLLANPNTIAFAVPNGIPSSKRTGARFKATGMVAGIPDLVFVLENGQVAFLELKSVGGRLSPEQRAFMEKCQRLRINHAVCADIDSALLILRGWGVLP